MALVAAARARACAGMKADELDFIIYGSCSFDEHVPNSASGLQARLGAHKAATVDVNTACTGFHYGISGTTASTNTTSRAWTQKTTPLHSAPPADVPLDHHQSLSRQPRSPICPAIPQKLCTTKSLDGPEKFSAVRMLRILRR